MRERLLLCSAAPCIVERRTHVEYSDAALEADTLAAAPAVKAAAHSSTAEETIQSANAACKHL